MQNFYSFYKFCDCLKSGKINENLWLVQCIWMYWKLTVCEPDVKTLHVILLIINVVILRKKPKLEIPCEWERLFFRHFSLDTPECSFEIYISYSNSSYIMKWMSTLPFYTFSIFYTTANVAEFNIEILFEFYKLVTNLSNIL